MSNLLFCYWTGDTPMSNIRKQCFDTMNNSGLQVLLITKNNLNDLVDLIDVPLHPGYKFLSDVHKADYLRCYVAHHLGGAYSDIKYLDASWLPTIKKFNKNDNEWILGYKEIPNGHAVTKNAKVNIELRNNWQKLIGCGNFVTKPKTSFTHDWYASVYNLMDNIYEDLQKYPARHPFEVYTELYKYPLAWTELLGDIFHPLCLKYSKHINQSLPQFKVSLYR